MRKDMKSNEKMLESTACIHLIDSIRALPYQRRRPFNV